MDVTKLVSLINTFSAQLYMSIGKSGHERVNNIYTGHYIIGKQTILIIYIIYLLFLNQRMACA